jgi:adenosine/AMP kinase
MLVELGLVGVLCCRLPEPDIIGVIDGLSPRAFESKDDKQNRSRLLRELVYKK